jgi:hypothetical protein
MYSNGHCEKKRILGQKNVKHRALVNTKIYLPPLHIKLGLIKMFARAMHEEGEGYDYLRKKFPRVSQTKIKGGIFVGPRVKGL